MSKNKKKLQLKNIKNFKKKQSEDPMPHNCTTDGDDDDDDVGDGVFWGD